MILQIAIAFSVYWLLAAIFAYFKITQVFRKFQNAEKLPFPQKYNGLLRQDFGKWNKKQIVKGCFLFFPINFFLMTSFLFTWALIGYTHKYLKAPIYLFELWRKYYGKIAVKTSYHIIEQFESHQLNSPIIISNHVQWFDIMYLVTFFEKLPSFVAKNQVKKVPIINVLAQMIDCVYIDRSSTEARKNSLENIKLRVENCKVNPETNKPVMIFPEGTTSNGQAILEFRNGAFESLCPITLFTLIYQSPDFNVGMEQQLSTVEIYFMSACIRPTLRVRKREVEAKVGESVEQYRQRCRKMMAQMSGFPIYDAGYKEVIEIRNQLKKRRKSS